LYVSPEGTIFLEDDVEVPRERKDDGGVALWYDVRLPPEDDMMYEFP
jgi:hypothetical protein